MTDQSTRAGFVALIGEPNAGKSTLLNRMVGAKVSIVTHKVQTTRARVRGVAMAGASQLIFVDTPGLFHPKRRLDRAMVAAAWTGAATHWPPRLTSRSAVTRSASARRSWSRMVTVTFIRSVGTCGLMYQSVTITPPLESVSVSGMKLSVSRLARHR